MTYHLCRSRWVCITFTRNYFHYLFRNYIPCTTRVWKIIKIFKYHFKHYLVNKKADCRYVTINHEHDEDQERCCIDRSYKIKCLEPYLDTHLLPMSKDKITRMIECITMNLAQCRLRYLIWYFATELNAVNMRDIGHLLKLIWMCHLPKLLVSTIWHCKKTNIVILQH